MKAITSALDTHFQGNLTTLATCWKVTRRDGEVFGFTDHDRALPIDGLKYVASSGYYRTAIANSATTSVDNLEVQGFLDDELISETDLRNGAYDFAEVEIFAVNWNDLSQGICRLRYGLFGETTLRPSGLFTVELRGLMQWLSQTVGETISPECRTDLGDERCKVVLVAPRRSSNARYSKDDRIIVPSDPDLGSYRLPIDNENFDWFETTSYFGIWTATNAYITNFPGSPKDGIYYVRPTGQTGNIVRQINVSPGTGTVEFEASYSVYIEEAGWQVGGVLELLKREGILGLTITVLDTIEIPYQTPAATLDAWTDITRDLGDVVVPAECNGLRLTLRWRPDPGQSGQSDPAPIRIDNPGVSYDSVLFTDEYMTFDTAVTGSTTNVPGWTGNFDFTNPGNSNLLPQFGTMFLSKSQWTGSPETQTKTTAEIGLDNTEIDAGNYVVDATAWAAAFEWGSASNLSIRFLTAGGSLISSITTGYEGLRPAGIWLERNVSGAVPPLTRQVQIRLEGDVTEEREGDGTEATTCYGRVFADFHHLGSDPETFTLFEGVEYIALNDGQAGQSVPSFTHTLGETVNDGSIQWQCVQPLYTFLGTVGTVTDNAKFTAPDIDAPDNWFKWGVLTFLDGANRTRGIEVLTWDNSTKEMTLMLPALMPIAPGTVFRVHAGCDHTRGDGGCKKFNNIINYRGEPEVPGTDFYFQVGGVGT